MLIQMEKLSESEKQLQSEDNFPIHNQGQHTFTEGLIGLDRGINRVVSYQYLKFQINIYKIVLELDHSSVPVDLIIITIIYNSESQLI